MMKDHDMRRFTAYRPAAPDTHTEDQKNAPDEVQYEGVVFSDGSCVLRWRTAVNSSSMWDSFEDAMRIHGHPEYGTRIVFHDEPIALPWEPEPPAEVLLIKDILQEVLGETVTVEPMSLEEFQERFRKEDGSDGPLEPPRTPADAWRIVMQHMDESCGYEGSELEEPDVKAYVDRYTDAWDQLDRYFKL